MFIAQTTTGTSSWIWILNFRITSQLLHQQLLTIKILLYNVNRTPAKDFEGSIFNLGSVSSLEPAILQMINI